MSGSRGRGGGTKSSLTLTPFGRVLGGVSLGRPWDKRGGPPGTRQMHVGMGRHWVGYLCLCMSNNEQPQCSANYFALHQHESKKEHTLHVRPRLFLGPFLPSSGSDQQVHLALGLHRSELIKSQTVKNFINSPS